MERDSYKKKRSRASGHVVLRDQLKPGDIGRLIYLHGTFYSKEYGYDQTFEAYVASDLAEFVNAFDQEGDRLWLAECEKDVVGSIAIVRQSKDAAQLRWFFVHPGYRGRGIGKRLLSEALRFCTEKKYKMVSLWTTSELETARHLYTSAGFQKAEEIAHPIWGKDVVEERYDLLL
ncbi:MAG TPA: GNAT family N-acetyltransferase [Candidatus Thermoplasmatota archaeon]|nr:GNAT family N-acetyltransferase [Candidatus Thermoplasmatota archaeon]